MSVLTTLEGIVTFREMKGPPVQEALELSESEEDLEVGDLDWENDDEAVKVAADNLKPEQPAQVMTQKTTSAKAVFTGEPTVSGDVPKTVKDAYSVNDIPKAVVPRRTLRVIEGLLENYDTYVRTERFASLSAGVFFRCRAIYDAVTSQIAQTTSSTANEVFLDENHYHAFIQLDRCFRFSYISSDLIHSLESCFPATSSGRSSCKDKFQMMWLM